MNNETLTPQATRLKAEMEKNGADKAVLVCVPCDFAPRRTKDTSKRKCAVCAGDIWVAPTGIELESIAKFICARCVPLATVGCSRNEMVITKETVANHPETDYKTVMKFVGGMVGADSIREEPI